MVEYSGRQLKIWRVTTEKSLVSISISGEFMKKLMAYLKDESGQTSTEYILLVAVVAMIVFKFKDTAGKRLTTITDSVFNKADTMVEGIDTN
jgi:pilus assembly protein Flp/PilA